MEINEKNRLIGILPMVYGCILTLAWSPIQRALANSVDTYQMPDTVASDQVLYCLHSTKQGNNKK